MSSRSSCMRAADHRYVGHGESARERQPFSAPSSAASAIPCSLCATDLALCLGWNTKPAGAGPSSIPEMRTCKHQGKGRHWIMVIRRAAVCSRSWPGGGHRLRSELRQCTGVGQQRSGRCSLSPSAGTMERPMCLVEAKRQTVQPESGKGSRGLYCSCEEHPVGGVVRGEQGL